MHLEGGEGQTCAACNGTGSLLPMMPPSPPSSTAAAEKKRVLRGIEGVASGKVKWQVHRMSADDFRRRYGRDFDGDDSEEDDSNWSLLQPDLAKTLEASYIIHGGGGGGRGSAG